MSYDNELKIALWKSDGTNPKAPILKGDATINGTKYDVALWKNDNNHPKAPTLKGNLQLPKDRPESNRPAVESERTQQDDFEDDIPF